LRWLHTKVAREHFRRSTSSQFAYRNLKEEGRTLSFGNDQQRVMLRP